MKRIVVLLAALMFTAAAAAAGSLKSYQVTGPVIELRSDAVVVEKGKEKWEIALDNTTKVAGELKKGSRATIQYQMKATSVEVKAEGRKKR